MGKYNVNFKCGHAEIIQLAGKIEDRYKKIDWLEREGLCSECYKKYKQKLIENESVSKGLPALEGTEKQINWAIKIRLDKIEQIQLEMDLLIPNKYQITLNNELEKYGVDGYISKITSEMTNFQEKIMEQVLEYCKLWQKLKKIKSITSAKWIIENE